jgi:RNA polymerase sigma-70 factor, ECF subfamily
MRAAWGAEALNGCKIIALSIPITVKRRQFPSHKSKKLPKKLIFVKLANDSALTQPSSTPSIRAKAQGKIVGTEQAITQLLMKWSAGDKAALDELMPLVYDDLRRHAQHFLRRRSANHTLQATALVHEAYLRLMPKQNTNWQNRAQFFGLAAKIMRDLLIDYARLHEADKRGGSQVMLSLAEADRFNHQSAVDLLALDQALQELGKLNPQYGQVVELRYFGGLTIEEAAEVLGVSHATIERDWKFSRAWLRRELSK